MKQFNNEAMQPCSKLSKHMKKHLFYLVIPALAFIAACKDEAEQIPAYLRIQPFTVNEPGGAGWQKFTDGWLYVNGEFLGAYTLPATVPVLAEGESEILVYPGVKENGINYTPNLYLFMKRYEATVNLSGPDQTTIQPVTAYDPAAIFPYEGRGDFDGSASLQIIDRDGDTGSTFSLTTDGAYAGKSLQMAVDTAHPTIDISTEKVALPSTAAQEVWLELHHKNDIPFTLNLLGSSSGSTSEYAQAVYRFNESEGWNKIYINLTEFLIAAAQEEYSLYFHVTLPKDQKGNYSTLNGKVLLDNMRLVHF